MPGETVELKKPSQLFPNTKLWFVIVLLSIRYHSPCGNSFATLSKSSYPANQLCSPVSESVTYLVNIICASPYTNENTIVADTITEMNLSVLLYFLHTTPQSITPAILMPHRIQKMLALVVTPSLNPNRSTSLGTSSRATNATVTMNTVFHASFHSA